jgi:hypothetical protein
LQTARDLISVRHVADPGAPRGIDQSIPKPYYYENDDKNGIWWVPQDNDV